MDTFIKCLNCGEVLHENTTGPESYAKDHENERKKSFGMYCSKLI